MSANDVKRYKVHGTDVVRASAYDQLAAHNADLLRELTDTRDSLASWIATAQKAGNHNAKLRMALVRIAGMDDERDEWDGTEKYNKCRDIAGAALAPAPKEQP